LLRWSEGKLLIAERGKQNGLWMNPSVSKRVAWFRGCYKKGSGQPRGGYSACKTTESWGERGSWSGGVKEATGNWHRAAFCLKKRGEKPENRFHRKGTSCLKGKVFQKQTPRQGWGQMFPTGDEHKRCPYQKGDSQKKRSSGEIRVSARRFKLPAGHDVGFHR